MNSPIKWVGGKRREIKHFEKYIPEFDTYVEPFVGGGALYWNLLPKRAEINDINGELINFYKVLRDYPDKLFKLLQTYVLSKNFFDSVVGILNEKTYKDDIERAAIFYYLNKTAFSGKWRVNKSGKFNSSYGYYTTENFKKLPTENAKYLAMTEISNLDYKDIMKKHYDSDDSFIFLDPPYLDCDTFYTETQDFENIYEYIKKYIETCKCKVMLVVKENDYLNKLFEEYIVDRYPISYSHNAKSEKIHNHIVVCNY